MTALLVDRGEDMSRDGFMRLCIEEDGDVIIAVRGQDGSPAGEQVQFCTLTGGGKSPRTREALLKLALAMAEDNVMPGTRHGVVRHCGDLAELRKRAGVRAKRRLSVSYQRGLGLLAPLIDRGIEVVIYPQLSGGVVLEFNSDDREEIQGLLNSFEVPEDVPYTEDPQWLPSDKMVYLPHKDGAEKRSFHCDCGSNVFRKHRHDELRYKCNSCGATYTGES